MNEIVKAAKGCGGRGLGYSKMKAEWTGLITRIIRNRKIPPMRAVAAKFLWTERKRNRNPDNIAAGQKFVWDALQAAGVIKNDGWSEVVAFRHSFQVGKIPGVEVMIEDADTEVP